jgi:hypothetical protein
MPGGDNGRMTNDGLLNVKRKNHNSLGDLGGSWRLGGEEYLATINQIGDST